VDEKIMERDSMSTDSLAWTTNKETIKKINKEGNWTEVRR
jgi:hypothetical protein